MKTEQDDAQSLVWEVTGLMLFGAVQNVRADVGIFNSMIAACAHGGEYAKARHMFASMAEAGCEPDAVTYANLIRAFKKGGQWCAPFHILFFAHFLRVLLLFIFFTTLETKLRLIYWFVV